MANTVNVGTVLIEVDTCLPPALSTECDAFSKTWKTLTRPDRRGFETELGAAGWTLFFLAGKTSATAFGFDSAKVVHRAVSRVLEKISVQGFNCAEITALAQSSLWRIPYITVSANARHIQPGMVLAGRKHKRRASGTGTSHVDVATGE